MKLFKLGISDDNNCFLCGSGEEDLDHVFFNCPYSRKIVDTINGWSGLNLPYSDLMSWRLNKNGTKADNDITNAIVNTCMYHIWHQRNSSRVDLRLLRPESLCARIIPEFGKRILTVVTKAEERRGFLVRRCNTPNSEKLVEGDERMKIDYKFTGFRRKLAGMEHFHVKGDGEEAHEA
ncbi:hypothetical protein RND81_03G067600 [Saponaria officinalis]|uniref:Reverse transcriptase zinc-binding domain-containing protein n=1 Tax=Saponaria officinalis TaxID=3572 RepID=A0AAW1M589_SAPOF